MSQWISIEAAAEKYRLEKEYIWLWVEMKKITVSYENDTVSIDDDSIQQFIKRTKLGITSEYIDELEQLCMEKNKTSRLYASLLNMRDQELMAIRGQSSRLDGLWKMVEEQYERLIDFCRENRRLTKHLDEVIILHETGLRVSEFCGLTVDDVDLERNVVRVEHQLLYYAGKLFIEAPKTKQGVRTIPMSAKAKEAFEHMIAIRPRLDKEPVVDGYSGFFQITPYGKPRRTPSVEANLKKIIMKYNESHPQDTLPLITPHSLRHMFCTRLVLSGMNLKAIQYIMGHKKMEMTLELYSHMNEKNAIKAFRHYMASDTNFDTNSYKNM